MWYKLPPPWSGITLPGASCVNREKGWHSSECGCSELRFMLFEEWGKGVNSQVEQYFNDCSSSGIFPLVNFDLWKPVSSSEKSANHWHPSENEYKNAVYKLVVKLQDKGLTRDTCLALCDNEPMVYYDWGQYIQYLKWMKQVIGSVFPIVSCNEEYALALSKEDFIRKVCQYGRDFFDYFGSHIQSSCVTQSDRDKWTEYTLGIMRDYAIPLTVVTEAFWGDIAKEDGYNLLLAQYQMAKNLKSPTFPMVFIRYNGNKTSWYRLVFILKGTDRTGYEWNPDNSIKKSRWLDWRKEMLSVKERWLTVYKRPEDLERFFAAMGWSSMPYNPATPNLAVLGTKEASKMLTWADYDAMEESQWKAMVKVWKSLGIVPADFPDRPDIKYITQPDGSYKWNPEWYKKATENPEK